MKKVQVLLWCICCFSCLHSASAQYTEQDIRTYINKYKELAINKMYEHQIPASITIAQGIFESACGTSRLAKEGNNHFGIKCHKDWTGDTILIDDDELQECFRHYTKVEESYNDHSLFLKNRPRYSDLFTLSVTDYVGWAKGLKAAGYATNPEYANRLISLIERFQLAQLDTIYLERLQNGYFANYPNVPATEITENTSPTPAQITTEQKNEKPTSNQPQSVPNKRHKPVKKTIPTDNQAVTSTGSDTDTANEIVVAEEKPTALTLFSAQPNDFPTANYPFTQRTVYVNNNTYFVITEKGDTYAKIARDVQDKEKRLKKFNEASGNAKLKIGQVVYIERKNKTGKTEYYTVINAESPTYISQKEAISLKKLCQYNRITPTEKLKKGRVIKLKK